MHDLMEFLACLIREYAWADALDESWHGAPAAEPGDEPASSPA